MTTAVPACVSLGGVSINRPQLVRFMQIDKAIRSGRYPNVTTLARDLGVSPRTVSRDLESMRREPIYAPIVYDPFHRGYAYASPRYQLPSLIEYSEGEVMAMFIALHLFEAYEGTPLQEPLRALIKKLPIQFADKVSSDFSMMVRQVSFDVEPLRGDPVQVSKWFEVLHKAAREGRRVHMRYFSASSGTVTERDVDPYQLHHSQGTWYVIGYCHLRNEVRMFALDRIQNLRETKTRFKPPADFDIRTYMAQSWRLEHGRQVQKVSIRFDPEQAVYVRDRRWHPSQTEDHLPDGSLVLHFEVTGLGEVERWVRQFGHHAEILEPETLRRSLAEEAVRVAEMYRDGVLTTDPGRPASADTASRAHGTSPASS